jgi:hypothetical protein
MWRCRLFGFFLGVVVVEAVPAAPAFPAAVDAMAQPVLLGMQLSTRKAAQRKTISEMANACVQSLRPNAFYGEVERILIASFSEKELAAIDRFFRTPVGQKYLRYGVLQLYSVVGERAPEPLPTFSDSEYKEIESFAVTPAGQMLVAGRVMQSHAARQAYDARIGELLESCKTR